MQPGLPVYLALPNSFEPYSSRMVSQEDAESLAQIAAKHANSEIEQGDEGPVPINVRKNAGPAD